ncbi:MAG: DUF4097 family beta strand repeat-containing protein [Acidobacteriia bacterium]|nr:DUF4097 family beta strand repeat-containing protein [Terriglobia bacterium]
MKKRIQIAALVLTAGLAVAQQKTTSRLLHTGDQWVEEITGTLPAARVVKVRAYAGAIRVQGNEQSVITYVARKHVQSASEKMALRALQRMQVQTLNANGMALINGLGWSEGPGMMELEIHIPFQTTLVRLQTSAGPITAIHIAGKVEAHTGGDVIALDQIGSDVVATTGGGDIEIGKIGGEIRVETGGGNIRIGTGEAMKLQTSAGSIRVNKCNGQIMATTGGGAIELNEVTGMVQVETAGGSIHLGPMRGGVHAETGSGPIVVDLAAHRETFTASRLETSDGDIIVYIPDDLGVTIQAAVEKTNGQGISSEFPGIRVTPRNNSKWGPRNAHAEGSVNGGGPLLIVHTSTGTIAFRRRNTPK